MRKTTNFLLFVTFFVFSLSIFTVKIIKASPSIEIDAQGIKTDKVYKPPRKVRVGVYDNKPKIYRDENGQIKGFWADIVDYIAKEEDWVLEYVHGNWAEGLERLEKNEIDIFVDVALSEERKLKYDFNKETFFINWASIYARKGVSVHSMHDLKDKKIAVMKSGIHYIGPLGLKNLTDSFGIEAEYIDVDVYGDVFELLESGEADVGVVNRIFGITNEGDYSNIKKTTIVFNPIELRFALTKGNPDNQYFIETIDQHLADLKNDPDSIYHQSIQSYLRGVVEEVEVIPTWARVAGIVALMFMVFVLTKFWNSKSYQSRLKGEVEERTKQLKKSLTKLKKQRDELDKKSTELERLNEVMVSREAKMADMKDKSRKEAK